MTPTQLRQQIKKDTIIFGVGGILILVIIGAVFFHIVEGHTWFDSVYFVMMTMTTVGYGDIVPTSTIWKLLTIVYAVTGVPLFIFMAGFIVEQRLSGLVKAYVKHHSNEIHELENQVSDISDDVEDISDDVEEISEDIEKITQDMKKMRKLQERK
jgi:voltage-gated potassium channel